ncbi:MAG: DUF1285 domain-containing protein [Candidatus Binataceae bacterium]
MPRAGFYAVESGKISFRRDGNWYTDEERIDNARIALLFSKSIQQNADGSYYLKVGDERASIEVEDTPYVVRTLEDDELGGFMMVLNDDEREPLDAATLEVGADNALYARVKDGKYRARFLRNAYYHLADRLEADDAGRFFLNLRGARHRIGKRSERTSLKTSSSIIEPAFHIVLVRPEIPQNTGSIARLAAATKTRLHLVGPLGFSIEDRYLKRAGLDYWPLVDLRTYAGWDEFAEAHREISAKFFSARARASYLAGGYARGDYLVFGSETKGLGREFLSERKDRTFQIPIFEKGVRSLNLANAVSIVVYEALRQTELIRP